MQKEEKTGKERGDEAEVRKKSWNVVLGA